MSRLYKVTDDAELLDLSHTTTTGYLEGKPKYDTQTELWNDSKINDTVFRRYTTISKDCYIKIIAYNTLSTSQWYVSVYKENTRLSAIVINTGITIETEYLRVNAGDTILTETGAPGNGNILFQTIDIDYGTVSLTQSIGQYEEVTINNQNDLINLCNRQYFPATLSIIINGNVTIDSSLNWNSIRNKVANLIINIAVNTTLTISIQYFIYRKRCTIFGDNNTTSILRIQNIVTFSGNSNVLLSNLHIQYASNTISVNESRLVLNSCLLDSLYTGMNAYFISEFGSIITFGYQISLTGLVALYLVDNIRGLAGRTSLFTSGFNGATNINTSLFYTSKLYTNQLNIIGPDKDFIKGYSLIIPATTFSINNNDLLAALGLTVTMPRKYYISLTSQNNGKVGIYSDDTLQYKLYDLIGGSSLEQIDEWRVNANSKLYLYIPNPFNVSIRVYG